MASEIGINAALVHPTYLHSIGTAHTWIFSAIAEIIDNACDTDVDARDLWIDMENIGDKTCLTFVDNGSGMNRDKLFKMLSFGFNDKEDFGKRLAIGVYGIGFKSGSMRIGSDAIVITRDVRSMSVGLLSQSYLSAIHTESVIIPVVSWNRSPSGLTRKRSSENVEGLKAILKHSIFTTETSLTEALDEKLGQTKLGTKIIIYNLTKDSSGNLELDFVSDKDDIRNPENAAIDQRANAMERRAYVSFTEHRRSLMDYCSILYLKPRLKIILRGKKVPTKWIEKTLSRTEKDVYNPSWSGTRLGVILTFGFTDDKRAHAPYGLMMYHKNRLIVAYKKIGCQTKNTAKGVGVIGVVEANFLEVTHNKQSFNKNSKYTAFINNAAIKLNDYYDEKTIGVSSATADDDIKPQWRWVQCDNCCSFRRLPRTYTEELPEQWNCKDNPDLQYNRCEIPEEAVGKDEEDVQAKPTYEKTVKKRKKEQRLQAKLDAERNAKEAEETLKAVKEERERLKKENEEALKKVAEVEEALKKVVEKKKPMEVLDTNTEMASEEKAKDNELSSQENTTKATEAITRAVKLDPNLQVAQQGLQLSQDGNQSEIGIEFPEEPALGVKQGQSLQTPRKRKHPGIDKSDEKMSRSRALDGSAVTNTRPVGGSVVDVGTITNTNPVCSGDKTSPPDGFNVSQSLCTTPGTSASSGTHTNPSPSVVLGSSSTLSTSVTGGTTATNSAPGISAAMSACSVNSPRSKFVPCRTSLDFTNVNSNLNDVANVKLEVDTSDRTCDKNEIEDNCKPDEQEFRKLINEMDMILNETTSEEVSEMKEFHHKGSQTMEYGPTEQTQALVRTTEQLNDLRIDILSLLKIILPGHASDLGDPKNIGNVVKGFLKANEEQMNGS